MEREREESIIIVVVFVVAFLFYEAVSNAY